MAKTQPQRSNFTLHVFPSITDPESTQERGHVKNLEHKSRTDRHPLYHMLTITYNCFHQNHFNVIRENRHRVK